MRFTSKIHWVDENVGLKGRIKEYNDSALGARSNPLTKTGQAPALERTLPDGTTSLVKFDGVDGTIMIDRKTNIAITQKSMEAAMRQSDALRQNGLKGRWEVPNADVKTKAQKLLDKVGIDNIKRNRGAATIMSFNNHLVKAIVDIAFFLEYSGPEILDQDVAVEAMEQLADELLQMTDSDQKQLAQQIIECATLYEEADRDFVRGLPEALGLG